MQFGERCHHNVMGTLQYGNDRFDFGDRLLAHVKLAIAAKLLKHESFLLNWTLSDDRGRVSVWLSRDSHLIFRFDDSQPPVINRRWVEALTVNAVRTGGMEIMDEDYVEAFLSAAGVEA